MTKIVHIRFKFWTGKFIKYRKKIFNNFKEFLGSEMGIRIFLLSTILVTTFLVTSIEASSKGGHCKCRLSWPEKSVKYHENNCNYGYKPSGHLKEVSAYDDLTYIQCTCGCKITDWHKKQRRRKTRITRSGNLDSEYLIRMNWKVFENHWKSLK